MTWDERAPERAREILIEYACSDGFISYSKLSKKLRCHESLNAPHHRGTPFSLFLDAVGHLEQSGGPMLTALVVYKDTTEVGGGFFKLAHELGQTSRLLDWNNGGREFHEAEVARVRRYWKAQRRTSR